MKRIYLDHGATTPLDDAVLETMMTVLQNDFGNPSALYEEGRRAKRIVENARKAVAKAIGANPAEIYFTAGGSESDNWVIKGIASKHKGKHIITTAVEHHAVLHACDFLEQQGYRITKVPVDGYGLVDPAHIEAAICPDTCLISVMTANNEVGTIQPIAAIGAMAKEKDILFHTDGVQALGAVPIDVNALNVDAMSLSAHKIYGPKGVGALYVRKGVVLDSLIHGGAQERKHRAGTENVAGIAGFGKAVELAHAGLDHHTAHLKVLRDRLIHGVLSEVPGAVLMGHPTERLSGNAHFVFENMDANVLLMRLDLAGISASAGSACTAGSVEPSHVLAAMGIPAELARGSLRLTLGRGTTGEDIARVIKTLACIVKDLRK